MATMKNLHRQEVAHLKQMLGDKDKLIEIYKLYLSKEYQSSRLSSGNVSGCNSFMGSPEAAAPSEHLMSVFYDLEEQRDKLKELQHEREAAILLPLNLQDYSPLPSVHSSFSKRRPHNSNSAASSTSKFSAGGGGLNTSSHHNHAFSGQPSVRTNLVSCGSVTKEYPVLSARAEPLPFLKSTGSEDMHDEL